MMKKLLFTLTLSVSFIGFLSAQNGDTLPNGTFEYWVSGNGYEDPMYYGTLNSSTSLVGVETTQKADQPADVHGGNYALRLETTEIGFPINQTAPGICALGNINTNTQEIEANYEFSHRPTTVKGWYKYSPVNGDTASVAVRFTKWNSSTNERDTIGSADWSTNVAASSYTMFEETVSWSSGDDPDTLIILFLSSAPFTPQDGSTLFLDDLEFTYSTVGIADAASEKVRLYPNPVKDELTIELNQEEAEFVLFDIIGKKVMQRPVLEGANKINLGILPSGTYIYRLEGFKDNPAKVGKLMVQ